MTLRVQNFNLLFFLQLKDELMKAIETQQMGPFYRLVCKDLKWTEDNNLIQRLAEQNEKTLKELVRWFCYIFRSNYHSKLFLEWSVKYLLSK